MTRSRRARNADASGSANRLSGNEKARCINLSLRIGWRRRGADEIHCATPCGRRIVGRRFEFVMLATILAGFWSMMSGTLMIMLLEAVGHSLA